MAQIEPVHLSVLQAVFDHMAGRVRYHLGAKAGDLRADPHSIHEIDCSGFVRYSLARATGGKLVIPDGSQNQRAWAERAGLHKLARYADVNYAADDPSRLFICFIAPNIRKGAPGHVWLVRAGQTMESYGTVGVGSRPWNARTLRLYAEAAYELPTQA